MDEPAPTVVVVGASAGGVGALTALAAELPEDLPAAVRVTLHLAPGAESRLAEIIDRAGPLPTAQARGGELLTQGSIFVAPPDRHLLVRGRHAVVVRGPHENGLRPAIDPPSGVPPSPTVGARSPSSSRGPATTVSRERVRSAPAGAASSRTRRIRSFRSCPRTRSRATIPTASFPSPSWRRPSPRWPTAFRRRSK